MPKHVVKQGECLSSIAARHGFGDWKTIYDHPQNAAFRKKRPNPNLLYPGDEIFVPNKKPKTVTVKAGQSLKLKVKVPKRELRLKLLDPRSQPLKDEPYTVEGGGEIHYGTTDGDGILKELLPARTSAATVFFGGSSWEIRLGDLNPIEQAPDNGISGVQARLKNLGYDPGAIDGVLGPRTRRAIVAFEVDHSLEPTGDAGDATIRKLKEVHGS